MKASNLLTIITICLFLSSCGTKESKIVVSTSEQTAAPASVIIPVDKGFSEYISGYTSGVISANGSVEIRFTPEFAAKVNKTATGLFTFEPSIKGKTEWKDDATLVFTPNRLLDPGKIYSGGLNLGKLAEVKERLKIFPLRIQTLKKDFKVTTGYLECANQDGTAYNLHGEIICADYVDPSEAEDYLIVKLGRKKMGITWDHTTPLIHKFTVTEIERTASEQQLTIKWDGSSGGVKQKGESELTVPAAGGFSVVDIIQGSEDAQKVDVIFSNPLDPKQETDGLIQFTPKTENTVSFNSNILTVFPAARLQGEVTIDLESTIKSIKGATLDKSYSKKLDFTAVLPAIKLEGNGVIIPTSQNLIFPFKAANLKAVDLRISKIFENNLPYFLQESDLSERGPLRRFGKQIYSGKVDLVTGAGINQSAWNLYSIDLSDYITVEPGVLYMVTLGMRKSYSLYPCTISEEDLKYEEKLQEADEKSIEDSGYEGYYYNDPYDQVYYSSDFYYNDRNDPTKMAYYSPDKRVTRNVLASNLGIMAKRGSDNVLHVYVNDLLSAMPVSEVSVDVYDYQMQLIINGSTNSEGTVAPFCERKPFLIIVKKDKDRNYLKVNDGSSLSLSSFDVSGNTPENGIKAFIYGERDVWRPGDSIYLSLFIKDLKSDLPPGHPVQFELINPKEQRVDNQVQKPNGSNLLVFETKTSADAMTGNYTAVFKVGGATFTKRIRIETIKPNRLKINLTFPGEILGGSENSTKGLLNAKWLNGTVAKNMKASVEYILKHTKTEFEKYGQYIFDDPISEFNSETVKLFNNTIDDDGNAVINFDPGNELKAPGMLTAVFTAKVMEPGGDESITQASWKFAPYPVFAGINFPALKGKERMLFTDADNEVKIVTVNEKGKPVKSEVEVEIYKISYRWWWESDHENLGYYISNRNYKPVLTKTLTTTGGEASFKFNIGKHDWGRYLVRVTTPEGHSTGRIILVDWPWEYGMKGNTEGATLLSINTNKEKYAPGEEIKLSFPAPENARVIVTLENSTGVLNEIRANTEKGNTVVTFKAKPEMAPNVYAYVTVLQPHAQTINDMPIRLYGIVPVFVEDPGTRLSPKIDMADEIRSQKPFTVKVSEANKKPMTYTLAIVDEGLLDITGFKTPDPWKYFYAREALGVQSWDLYDMVLGAFGGTLERVFAIGGDELLSDKSANKAKRFIPVVKFLGPFSLDAGKTNSHTITLPQYTGSVKVMVVAGNDRAFGIADKAVPVKDPLMLLVTAPRVLSPGEKVALPMTLFIQKEGIKEITINAESNGLLTFEKQTATLQVSGTGEKDTEFSFTTGEKTGIAKISVTATGGGESAKYELEIDIRSPNPEETSAELKILKPGEKWQTSYTPFGIEGSNSASVEATALPSINMEKRLDYLITYPHGCSEQITSGAFPQLWLTDVTGSANDAKVSSSVAKNIKAAITLLSQRQMINGGIALWPGSIQPDNWVTSYAGHFLIEAEKKGYSVPSGLINKWAAYQKKTAQDWKFDKQYKQTANDQAYRLFSLALAGQPDKGAMNRLRENPEIPQLAKWLLSASFALTGRPEISGTLLDMRKIDTESDYYDYYYGSHIRDKSIILYTLTILKKEDLALPVLKEICDNFNSESWISTQSIAWGLFSYMKWSETIPQDNSSIIKVKIDLNNEKSENTIGAKQVFKKSLKMISGTNNLSVENGSAKTIYITLSRKGIPLVSDVARAEKGLTMKTEYVTLDLKPIDPKSLQQGTDFLMVVKVTNGTFTYAENLALTQMVPSGWEIQNTRLFEAKYGIRESSYDYRDFRDDRVNTYFSLTQGETKTFVLILNAAYKGEFLHPSVWCEAMYNPNCYSRIPGFKTIITGQKLE